MVHALGHQPTTPDEIADAPGLTPEQQKEYKRKILESIALDKYAATPQGILELYGPGALAANMPAVSVMPDFAVPAIGSVVAGIAQKSLAGGQTVQDFVSDNKVPIALGATALGIAGAVAATVAVARSRSSKRRSSTRRSSPRRRSAPRRRGGRKLKFGSPAWRKRYMKKGKRKGKKQDRNRRGGAVRDKYKGRKVYRTKRGQPYILMANGKARFVKA